MYHDIKYFLDIKKNKIVICFVLLFFAILSFPSSLYSATGGLDPSWVIGIHMAKTQNLTWGKDMIFTYGPLAYLFFPIDINQNLWTGAFFYTIISHGLFFLAIGYLINKSNSPFRNSLIFGIISIIILKLGHTYFPLIGILVGFYLYLEYCKKPILLIPLSFLTSFLMFTKLDVGIGSSSILIFSCTYLVIKKRWKEASISLISYGVFIVSFWISMTHSITGLRDYFATALMITSGYAPAMSLDTKPILLYIAIISWCLYFWWIYISVKNQRQNLKYLILSSVILFIFFKVGFVRDSGHELDFFLFWSLIFLVFLFIPKRGKENKPLRYSTSIMIMILILCGIAVWNNPGIGMNITKIADHEKDVLVLLYTEQRVLEIPNYIQYLTNEKISEQHITNEKNEIKKYFIISPNILDQLGNHTIDIMPWDNAVLYAYNLKWHPRPVLQSLNVYNNDLDNLDAEFFKKSDSPDFILYKIAAIDDRYPLYDEPYALQVILCKYHPIGSAGDFLILQKNENICYDQRTISEQEVNFGQKIEVPKENDGYLFAKIYVEQNILGKISYVLYKPPEVVFQINDEDTKYRLIPKTATDGIVISSAPNLKNQLSIVQKDIHSIRIMSNLDYYFVPKIKIEFVEIKIKTSSPSINQKTAFMYNNPFDILNEVYVVRPDLQQVFPEVEKDDFKRLAEWAKLSGVKEYQKINNSSPMFDLLYIYYARQDLQDAFPEVKTRHNFDNLLKWVLEHGISEDPTLKTEKDFFLSYKT